MKIGITYDLKTAAKAGAPDDADEEFDSPHTIEAIAKVLRDRGHEIVLLGDDREFLEKALAQRPDFVFNFAEGHGISRSREARVPAALLRGREFVVEGKLPGAAGERIVKQLLANGPDAVAQTKGCALRWTWSNVDEGAFTRLI